MPGAGSSLVSGAVRSSVAGAVIPVSGECSWSGVALVNSRRDIDGRFEDAVGDDINAEDFARRGINNEKGRTVPRKRSRWKYKEKGNSIDAEQLAGVAVNLDKRTEGGGINGAVAGDNDQQRCSRSFAESRRVHENLVVAKDVNQVTDGQQDLHNDGSAGTNENSRILLENQVQGSWANVSEG
ncbi:hypothetical protein NE237_007789 [Protea cynaroides]|uniref:Uncharacterized protein n=1 Tax=Protea cynaroides TaxID=273540 RepID=A0A9Q0KQ55_9MAGN|nr:hypothetical protein NE237_007789 [Protea cynaroides]